MNFAFSTLLFFYFIFPGFLARRAYFSGEFSNQYIKSDFTRLTFSVIFPSTLLHLIGFYILDNRKVFSNRNFKVIAEKYSSLSDDKSWVTLPQDDLIYLIGYFIVICLLGLFFGFLLKVFIRRTKLDRYLSIFRYRNKWHYIFSGEILDFPGYNGNSSNIDFTHVDVLTDTQAGTFIYSGILQDYQLGEGGGLYHISLTSCKRKEISPNSAIYKMPGHAVIIPFAEIKNFHVTYYKITQHHD